MIETKAKRKQSNQRALTLIALVITIVLKCCRAALERMFKKEIILNI